MKYLDGPSWFAIVAFCVLLALLWCARPTLAEQTVFVTQTVQDSTVTALRAEVASLKKRQKIERYGCAVFGGFTLWRVSR